MPKRIKITLYVILILVIIAVVWLMFWNTNFKAWTSTNKDIEISTWNDVVDLEEPDFTIDTESSTFEDDVMKDLEWFFNDNKGYEDVQWEYWFTNPENEQCKKFFGIILKKVFYVNLKMKKKIFKLFQIKIQISNFEL